jgi:hypothetical protein
VAAAPETPAASTTISLADVAGKWKVRTMGGWGQRGRV